MRLAYYTGCPPNTQEPRVGRTGESDSLEPPRALRYDLALVNLAPDIAESLEVSGGRPPALFVIFRNFTSIAMPNSHFLEPPDPVAIPLIAHRTWTVADLESFYFNYSHPTMFSYDDVSVHHFMASPINHHLLLFMNFSAATHREEERAKQTEFRNRVQGVQGQPGMHVVDDLLVVSGVNTKVDRAKEENGGLGASVDASIETIWNQVCSSKFCARVCGRGASQLVSPPPQTNVFAKLLSSMRGDLLGIAVDTSMRSNANLLSSFNVDAGSGPIAMLLKLGGARGIEQHMLFANEA